MVPLPLKVPPLLVQFPDMLCVYVEPLKIVPEPIVTFPPTVIPAPAAAVTVPDKVKSPPMVNPVPGIVFVPLPLRISVEYPAVLPFGFMSVWAVPLYSIVFAEAAAFKTPLPTRLIAPEIRMTFPVWGVSEAPFAMVTL